MPREKLRIVTLFGTRPELIKLFPVIARLRDDARFALTVVSTSQHREMIDDLLRLFAIRPDHDLDILRPDQTLTDISVHALQGLQPVLAGSRAELLLIQGDTTSATIGALAAFYQRIPVAHVEAGLRSFDRAHPYPEEINRRLISTLSELHFAPLAGNRDNLLREGVNPASVCITGNTAIDALRMAQGLTRSSLEQHVPHRALAGGRLVLVTAHRRESLGTPLDDFCRALLALAATHPDIQILFPMHLNPRVRQSVVPLLRDCDRIHLVEPLAYDIFVQVMARSYLIITDSGGIQEEAPSLGKPVLVFRKVTERVEGLASCGVWLVGLDPQQLLEHATRLLDDQRLYAEVAQPRDIYGDGQAAQRIVDGILHHFDRGERPAPFTPSSANG